MWSPSSSFLSAQGAGTEITLKKEGCAFETCIRFRSICFCLAKTEAQMGNF